MPPEVALGFCAEAGAEDWGLGVAGVDVEGFLGGWEGTYSAC